MRSVLHSKGVLVQTAGPLEEFSDVLCVCRYLMAKDGMEESNRKSRRRWCITVVYGVRVIQE